MLISEWIQIFQIVDRNRPGVDPIAGAEHDLIFLSVDPGHVPEDTEDGKVLKQFGCFVQDDNWAVFV